MQSESARMSTAAEARFRVPAPAAVARVVKVIALDPDSDAIVARLAEGAWGSVTFYPASAASDRGGRLIDDIVEGDLVMMVTAAGADAVAAAQIGRSCSDRRVHTATVIVRTASASDEQLSKTLVQVRPWSLMVVIVSDDNYVEDILRSFR
jgi:hypothetical protein